MAQHVTSQMVEQVFASIYKTLTQDDIESLHLLFDKLLLPALDMIDNGKVSQLCHPTISRGYYQVASASSPLHSYTVFWNHSHDHPSHETSKSRDRPGMVSYCPCPDYQIKMWASSQAGSSATPILMCKHLLAVRVASRLNRVSTFIAQNEDEFLGTLIWNPKS